MAVIKNVLYVGAVDLITKKSYLLVNNISYSVSSPIDLIYPMQGEVYFASFKRNEPNGEAKYYRITREKSGLAAHLQGKGKIVIFRE